MEKDNELDFELVNSFDGDDVEDQDTIEQDDSSDDIWDDEDTSKKKNPSNFKKLSKAHKGAIAKIKELESKLKQNTVSNSEELRFFFLENPEAKEFKWKMLELMSEDKYKNLDISDILDLAKLRTPKESTDKQDFNFKSNTNKVKKRLEDLDDEEALKLDNKNYLEWTRLKKAWNKSGNIWG